MGLSGAGDLGTITYALLLKGGMDLESDGVRMLPWASASLGVMGRHGFHRSYWILG